MDEHVLIRLRATSTASRPTAQRISSLGAVSTIAREASRGLGGERGCGGEGRGYRAADVDGSRGVEKRGGRAAASALSVERRRAQPRLVGHLRHSRPPPSMAWVRLLPLYYPPPQCPACEQP